MHLRSDGSNSSSLGFRRPASWRLVVLIALAAAALRIVLGYVVIDPLTARFWPPAVSPQGIDEDHGRLRTVDAVPAAVWALQRSAKMIAYRGYLLIAARMQRSIEHCVSLATIVVAVVFGYGHSTRSAGVLGREWPD